MVHSMDLLRRPTPPPRLPPVPLPEGAAPDGTGPDDIDPNEATYVDPMFLQGGAERDTGRGFRSAEPETPPPEPAPVISTPPALAEVSPPVFPDTSPGADPGAFPAVSPPVLPAVSPAVSPGVSPGLGAPSRPSAGHPAFGGPAGRAAPVRDPILLPGSIVGRYAIHSHIGMRGMGALYRAHDPRLGRDVALQVWRASSFLPAAASPAGMRFLQQARSLAKLSHPNVLALYDVGALGPSVFVTMEIFSGVPLDRWLAAAPRKLSKILDVFAKAGRGLTAAHAAGLLHRDFQPEHILVAKGNDVRVIDFGLTRALATAQASEVQVRMRGSTEAGLEPRFPRADSSTELELGDFGRDEAATEIDISLRDVMPTEMDMERDGVFGQEDDITARMEGGRGGARDADAAVPLSPYAAPEQHAGGAVTARSDQFAFCAVLYEAVCGVKPFAGDTPAAVLDNIRAGRLSPPTSSIDVPKWLDALLRRGLAAAPEARHESMDALLTELEARRTRRSRQLRWAAIVLGVLGAVAGGALYATMGDDPCADAQKRMSAVWNQRVSQTLATAFTASGAPDAPAMHTRVAAALDDYSRAWLAMHADACEVAGARAARDKEQRQARLQCLSDRLRSLQALTRALATADRVAVANAVDAASRLPAIESCTGGDSRRPLLPEKDATVAALQAELAEAAVQVALGQHERVADAADALLERAQRSEIAPLQAQAHLLRARIQTGRAQHAEAEASLRQALRLAEQARDDELAAEIWIALVDSVGLAQARPAEALALREAAEAALARAPAVHQAALSDRLALVLTHLGRHDEARTLVERALALLAKARGQDSVHAIEPLATLGTVLQRQGHARDALAPLERALALTERHLGRAHARQVPVLMALGAAHLALGQPEPALSSFTRARSLEEASHGPRTAAAAEIATEMGRALCWQGMYEKALTPLETALELGTKLHGAEHPRVAPTLLALAEVRAATGEHDLARTLLERALAIRERQLGGEHPDTVAVRARLGHALVELGQGDRARPLLEGALATLEKTRGEEHPDLAPALSGLGALWRQDAREKRARRYLERLLSIQRKHYGNEHPAVAATEGALGEALLIAERPAAARAAFARARAILEAEGRLATPLLARVLTGLAACELAANQTAAAILLLERALAIHAERPGDPIFLARTRFALARALWSSRTDRTRALTLGQQASEALTGLGPRGADDLAAVKKWLESDGP